MPSTNGAHSAAIVHNGSDDTQASGHEQVALHTTSSGAHNLTGARGSTVEAAEGDAAAYSPVGGIEV